MREPGFYWVNDEEGWTICRWDGNFWNWPGTDNFSFEYSFDKINERRIVREGYTDLSSDEEKEKRAKELYIEIGKVLRKYGLP